MDRARRVEGAGRGLAEEEEHGVDREEIWIRIERCHCQEETETYQIFQIIRIYETSQDFQHHQAGHQELCLQAMRNGSELLEQQDRALAAVVALPPLKIRVLLHLGEGLVNGLAWIEGSRFRKVREWNGCLRRCWKALA